MHSFGERCMVSRAFLFLGLFIYFLLRGGRGSGSGEGMVRPVWVDVVAR